MDNIGKDVKKALEEEGDEEGLKALSKTVDNVRKRVCASILIFNTRVMFLYKDPGMYLTTPLCGWKGRIKECP